MHLRKLPLISVGLIVAFVLIFLHLRNGVKLNESSPSKDLVYSENNVSVFNVTEIVAEELLTIPHKETEVFQAFDNWMADYLSNNGGDELFINEGVEIAKVRRKAMLRLLQEDSVVALDRAIGFAEYASLPDEVKQWVEEPFTESAQVDVVAVCFDDTTEDEYLVNVSFSDNRRAQVAAGNYSRTGLSKRAVPIQGIRLDDWSAIHGDVFVKLEGEDRNWALGTLNIGNPDLGADYYSGESLSDNAIVTVAGGSMFLFNSDDSAALANEALRNLDDGPGFDVGSSVVLKELQMKLKESFTFAAMVDSQLTMAIASSTGSKTALFIRVEFADYTGVIDQNILESRIDFDVSNHLSDYSYGKTSMDADVSSSVYILGNRADYEGGGKDHSDLLSEAKTLYMAGNPNPNPLYDVVGVIFPELKVEYYAWAGLASVGGQDHWLNGTNSATVETILHEFGHNYGLSHSNYWVFDGTNTNSTNPVDSSGLSESYGDFWDTMGKGTAQFGHFSVGPKRSLNWLASNDVASLSASGDSGTYRIYRFDDKNAGVNVDAKLFGLEINKSATGDKYWLGFRRSYPSNANYYQGVNLMWEHSSGNTSANQSWLVDTTPESPSERQDAGISIGRTYSDTASNVFVTPVSIGGNAPDEYIDVVVNFGPYAGNQNPTGSINVPVTGDARVGIAMSASGNDGDGDSLAYSWDLGTGQVYPNSDSVMAVFPVGGSYDVSVTISDMKGGKVSYTSQIVVEDPVNNWNTRSSGTVGDLSSIGANGTSVVAGGFQTMLRSLDGQSWSTVTPGSFYVDIRDIIWTGSEYVGVGAAYSGYPYGTSVVYTSSDGTSWSQNLVNNVDRTLLLAVASNDDGSLIIAGGWSGALFLRNALGNWSSIDLGLPSTANIESIAYGDGMFVLGGYDQGTGDLVLFRTAEGIVYESLKDNSDLESFAGLDMMEYINGLFIGSGFYSRMAFSENGGVNWQTLQQGTQYDGVSVAYGNGVYYSIVEELSGSTFVGYENMVSSDGRLWSLVDGASSQVGTDITFFKDTFIIVGDSGKIVQTDEVISAASGFDTWISSFYSGADALASANPDGDWAPNLFELAMGSLPDDGASFPREPTFIINQSGNLLATLYDFLSSTGVDLSVEYSTDLETWIAVPGVVDVQSTVMYIQSIETFDDKASVFFRIRAVEM